MLEKTTVRLKNKGSLLKQVRAICLALPEAVEVEAWGHPTFRVGKKIFAGFGEHEGRPSLGFKPFPAHEEKLLEDPRFFTPPYVGRFGWVSVWLDGPVDWDQIRGLVTESYRQIAPKRLAAALDALDSSPAPKPRRKQ
jgi:predicted DNA-binding protein (MmcQ/YjbR family)